MDIQEMLNKITGDAKANAAVVLEEAKGKTRIMTEQLEKRIAEQKEQVLRRVEDETLEMRDRMNRMAELEEKKERLKIKRQVLDEAFDAARMKLEKMPASEKRALFLRLAAENAEGEIRLFVGSAGCDWFDQSFAEDVNRLILSQGKDAHITAGEGKTEGCGFVLRNDSSAVDCTMEALLSARRLELETEAAAILFPEH